MKLATLNNGTRDGQLMLVSRDLQHAVVVSHLIPTLQAALDDWAHKAPLLEVLAQDLDAQRIGNSFAFEPRATLSPLPRTYQWVDGSAYVNHMQWVRRARGADMPTTFWTEPLVYQGGSDDFLAPMADAVFASEAQGIDFEAEVAVITDDVAMGTTPDAAYQHIKLLLLVNDWSLRNLIPAELAKGFGFYVSKPATAFSPVAVTPDELGAAWDGSKLHLPLLSMVNQQLFGQPDAGVDMTFDFDDLISHITQTRRARAGTIVGSGTVSNRDASTGSSCIAERRALEQLQYGEARTPYLRYGDVVRIEMRDTAGHSIFGAIEQHVASA